MDLLKFKSNETFYYSNISNTKDEENMNIIKNEKNLKENLFLENKENNEIYSDTYVWYFHNNIYKKMEIYKFNKLENTYNLKRKGSIFENIPADKVTRCLKDEIEVDSENNIDILQLNEENVMENLKNRYKKNKIYTFHASLLLAINPYKQIKGLYDIERMDIYLNKFKNNNVNNNRDFKAHIYDISNMAYKNMILKKKRQTIIVSGHSGSGKTENCKFLFKYFHYIFFHKNDTNKNKIYKNMNSYLNENSEDENEIEEKNELLSHCKKLIDNNDSSVKDTKDKDEKTDENRTKKNNFSKMNENINYERIDKLIYINNIIESMSNAKTIKNNNSSRCGRINDLIFEEKKTKDDTIFNYCFSNIKILILLLEINRCITQNVGERNFHVFYQLIWGLTDEQLKERNLIRDIHYYNLLNNDAYKMKKLKRTHKVEKNDSIEKDRHKDEKNFEFLLNGLRYINYDENTINQFHDVIAGIIHLGEIDPNEDDILSESYKNACECLKIDLNDLQNTIKYKNINVSFEKIRTQRNKDNSLSTLHTLIKVIYKNLFNRIINDINITNLSDEEREQIMNENIYASNTNVISILDLYGFEELSCNDFEQLCINLANEKLNNYYINNEIEKEKIIYKSENLLWNDIKIPDYKDTITFIEKIFANLDDITKLNSSGQKKVDDHFFTYLLNNEKNDLENNIYGFLNNKDNTYTKKKENIKKNKFFVKHYAGYITYNINNWIHKNSDKIEVEIEDLIKTSKNLFLNGDDELENEGKQKDDIMDKSMGKKKDEKEKEKGKEDNIINYYNKQENRKMKKNKEKYYTCENFETRTKSKNNVIGLNNQISVENNRNSLEKNKMYLKNEKNEDMSNTSIEKGKLTINKLNKDKNFLKVDMNINLKYNTVISNSLVKTNFQGTNLSTSSLVCNIPKSNSNNKNNILSVSKKYIKELDRLFNNLQKTDMYYIRCILPNENMEKDNFKRRLVYAQLKQCGANEMIKIINNGLSHKILKDKLLEKCKNCTPNELQHCSRNDIIYYFMRLFDLSKNFKIGTNYIFMKSHTYTQINYFFYNNFSLNDNIALEKQKEIFKEIRIMRFRRCVTIIKINNWINKYYKVYLKKKNEMKRKACDYIYKIYLIYKTMLSIKETFSYNIKKLNRILCNLGYYFAFKKMKNAKRSTFLSKVKKREETVKNKKELEEKLVTKKKTFQDKELGNKIKEFDIKNELRNPIIGKDKSINSLHGNGKSQGLHNGVTEIFVSTPDNYHYIYNNLDWVITYINKKVYFYKIFYNYERINKKYVLSYDTIRAKKLYPIKNEKINNYEEKSECSLIELSEKSCNLKEKKYSEYFNENTLGSRREIVNDNLKKQKKNTCYLLRDFHCISQHSLYKNIFIGIDENLSLIIFTYPNLRTIKKFLKKKIKSMKHNNGNLPKTNLPLLYKRNRYDSHLQKRVDIAKRKCENFVSNNKKEDINRNEDKEFETKDPYNVFSEENINMFIHMYKNVYVLSNIESVFKKEKKEENYEKEVVEIEGTKLKKEFYEKNDKIKEDENFKEINKKRYISFSSFLKELKKEEYMVSEFYSNPSFKILKICFLPSSISYFVYLAYALMNDKHYLLLTIVNFLSKPIYKFTTYILIDNLINNEDFFNFFIKSYNHINFNNKINTSGDESNIEKKNVINSEHLDKYLSTLKISIINNTHILIYGSCLLSLIEVKNYDLNNANPYIKEYEYKYLKLIFNLYCFEYFNNICDSYVNKLSYDLKHNLIMNDLFKYEKKDNFVILNESKKRTLCSNENDKLTKDIKNKCECMFYIFSLFDEIYLLTNKNEENSFDVLFNYEKWKIMKLKNSNTSDMSKCNFQGVMNMNINYYYNKDYYKSFIAISPSIQATIQKYNNNNTNKNFRYKSVFPDVYILKEMRYSMCKKRNSFYYNLKNQEIFTLYNEKDEYITPNDNKYLSYNILAYSPLNHLDTILLLNYSNEMDSYTFEFINIVSKNRKIITLEE